MKKGEKEIFQRRYFEHTTVSENDLNLHLHYIHYNLLKHGLVNNIRDWEIHLSINLLNGSFYDENRGTNDDDIKNIRNLNFE